MNTVDQKVFDDPDTVMRAEAESIAAPLTLDECKANLAEIWPQLKAAERVWHDKSAPGVERLVALATLVRMVALDKAIRRRIERALDDAYGSRVSC